MTWPDQKAVARALGGGLCEVFAFEHGVGKGVRGPGPLIFFVGVNPAGVGWLTSQLGAESMPMRPFVVCRKCDVPEMMPPPLTSQGLNGKGEPLFSPGTSGHALHVLTWLHDFERRHAACCA